MTRAAAVVSLLCATLSACEPAPEPRPASAPVATPVAESRFYPARVIWELTDPAVTDSVMLSKAWIAGIVFPAMAGNLPGEISIVNDTAHEVQTIARQRWYAAPEGGYGDTLWVRDRRLYAAPLERATHEDYGFAATARHGTWAHVVFAYDSSGIVQRGWVRIEPPRVMYADYDSLLLNVSTQFSNDAAVTFFDRPGGRRVAVNLEPSHAVRVIGFDRDWIKVMLTAPDTSACTGNPDAKIIRRDTLWVPRLNTNKDRQLYAATAGC